ncbi:MAG: ATP synthase F0 subunit C [Alphaproteobacteria bacterium]|nr:ATP synthase F0 subunit C [Alphaproteobacteria bacterium]MBR1756367.1 ATP synthase F0 subunit C [Alphaproteobacteria bacterium]
MDSYAIIGAISVLGACICMGIGSLGSALGEGAAASAALTAMAQQPDEASRIRSTMFVSLAMLETTALYSLLIAFLALYANPFWNYAIAQ